MKVVIVFSLFFISLVYSYTLSSTEIQNILNAHNTLRQQYGVTTLLVWDTTLATGAQSWANGCTNTHSTGTTYGENIASAWSSSSGFPAQPVESQVGMWNAEKSNWNCASNTCSGSCEHFTQDVWKTTTNVGCGLGQCVPGTINPTYQGQFFVCRYTPAGNQAGQHPLNAPSSSPGNTCSLIGTNTTTNPPNNAPTASPKSSPTAPPTNPPKSAPTAPKSTPTAPPSNPPKNAPTASPKSTPTAPPTNPPKSAPTAPPTNAPTSLPTTSWAKCTANFNGVITLCQGAPWVPQGSTSSDVYCPVGDPEGYSWSLTNYPSADCNPTIAVYGLSDSNTQSSNSNALSSGAWIGIGIGIILFVVIFVVIAVVILKKRNQSEKV